MNINFKHEGVIDTLVIGVSDNLSFDAPHLPNELAPFIDRVLDDRKDVFQGKVSQSYLVMFPENSPIQRALLIGCTDKQSKTSCVDSFTKLGGYAAKALSAHKLVNATIGWHSFKKATALEETDALLAAAYFAQGMLLSDYKFDKYITNNEKKATRLEDISFVDTDEMSKDLWSSIEGTIRGVFLARDVVNEPPNVLNPATFVEQAEKLSEYGLKVKVIKGAELQKLKMGGIMSVGRASSVPPRLLVIEWKGKTSQKYNYGFVGKGITFDTGGLCVKPGPSMLDMKSDMAGGAAVLGCMLALALNKAASNVIAAIPLAENMIGGDAYRPSDTITTHSGKTIEVVDTDAEGRIVLADALTYISRKYKPDFMVDLATLTGAVIVALGCGSAALCSNCDELSSLLSKAGSDVGEKLWELPMYEEYSRELESHVADLRNCSQGYGAGTITAAKFLENFIEKGQRWAHLDIAGVAFRAEKSPLYDAKFATGYGVRLLTKLVLGEEYV